VKGLDETDGCVLVATAKEAIASALKRRVPEYPLPSPTLLAARGGLFVSLHRNGALRGCIGHMSSPLTLVETAKTMAAAAAFEDPRFEPLAAGELADLDVEITVLGELFRISGPGDFEIGRHGLFIASRGRSGVLLPQVAVEYGWSPEVFLAQVCRKAGLDPSEWRSLASELYAFDGSVFR
jgi:AmmeMemoRadiSam system protein A